VVVEVGVAGFAGAAEVSAVAVPGADVAVLFAGGPVAGGHRWWPQPQPTTMQCF
jgi:hypothetical protein